MQIAPVLVKVYNRKNHFIDCIESLSKCRLADKTHLFIASDGGKTDQDKEIVKEIRDYCRNISGFKKVELLASDENLGASKTGRNANVKVFSDYDRIIFSEDDNVFAQNFLVFINEGLEFYKYYQNVLSICGYKHHFKIPDNYPHDTFSSKFFSAWGYGTWKKKYLAIDRNLANIDVSLLQNKQMSSTWRMLMLDTIKNNKVYGDAFREYHCIKNDMVNIFPVISLVQNHGNDGSGMHCNKSPKYATQEICTENRSFKFIGDVTVKKDIQALIADSIDFPFMSTGGKLLKKIVTLIKVILTKLYLYNLVKIMMQKNSVYYI